MKTKIIITLISAIFLVIGCSANDEEGKQKTTSNDHFLKEKTDMVDKAKQVQQMLDSSEERKRKSLEEQTR